MKRQVGKLDGWLLILLSILFVPLLLAAPAAAQTVTVLSPNGGDALAIPPVIAEEWTAGSSHTIRWTTEDAIGPDVDITLYKAGVFDSTIQAAAANTGAFVWTIPADLAPGIDYTVEVASLAVPAAVDQSDADFTISPAVPRVITYPAGGESWLIGTTETIIWQKGAVDGLFVNLRLSRGQQDPTQGGDSIIALNIPNTGSFTWDIPSSVVSDSNYRVKVEGVFNGSAIAGAFAYSDNYFSILDTGGPSSRIITYPVGGEVWLTGETRTITWQQGAVPDDMISLYLVRGQSDPSPGGNTIIILNIPNSGSFDWVIPKSIPSDVNYRVMLSPSTADMPPTYSDNYFTITQPLFRVLAPNGGDSWVAGTTRTISWATTGAAGATVDIDLYKGGALETNLAAATANTGSFTWNIPAGQPLGNDYVVRITSTATPTLFDESDAPFTIGSSAGIVTAPAGGEVWLGGETRLITWQVGAVASDTVDLFLVKGQSDPNPGDETPIILNTPNNGSFPWVIPSSILSDTDYRIKLVGGPATAYTDNYFSILQADFQVVSPNGGEKWLAGSTHTITWTSTGAAGPDVRIDLFKRGVLNSVIATSTPDDGSFAWTIRNEQNPGSDYTVRVTSLTNAQVAGESAEDFTVVIGQPYDILLSNDTASIYSPIGTLVGAFTTLDPNPGDTFTYSLDFCAGCDNASFSIAGGTLRTAEVFMTIGATKNITVTSTDQSGQEVTKNFKVFVVGPDQLPSDLSLNDSMIVTGLPVGSRVGEFSTVDPNAADPNYGETFLYTLVAGPGSTDNADFTIVGNQLQTDTIFLAAATVTRSIRVRTTDRTGLFREEIFIITINVNQPPVLNPIGNKAVNEGQNLSFTLSATDPNGDPLIFSASGMPSGATLTGANFSWTPSSAQAGVYTVHFEVTDGSVVDSEDIVITVSDVNPTLFFEQFTDGTSAGDANWNKNAGAWTVPLTTAMRYRATSAGVTSLSTVKTTFLPKISSGRVESVVRMLNLAPSQNGMLIFAFQGNGRYRYAQLVSGGEVRIGQVGAFGGATAGIKARNAVSAAVGTNYALRLDTYPDGRVRVYFKGALVLNYKFPTAVLGTVGVGVVNNGAEFDNFRVSDATVLPARVR